MPTTTEMTMPRASRADLLQPIRRAKWRSRNAGRVLRHWLSPSMDLAAARIALELRRDGITSTRFADAFQGGEALWQEVNAEATRLWEEATRGVVAHAEDNASGYHAANKDYRAGLLPSSLSLENPFVKLALDPRPLEAASRYLGMEPLLRSIELWNDKPTTSAAKETQLWHKDGDDYMNVKAFVYFNDVDVRTGPFCYIPRTHPLGVRRDLRVEQGKGRSTDEQMERAMPQSSWRICTAPAGTVTFADTCGYHKGLKPSHNERLMLMIQYTSGLPHYPRTLQLVGQAADSLTPAQRLAIGG